jgi:hypothetical protein
VRTQYEGILDTFTAVKAKDYISTRTRRAEPHLPRHCVCWTGADMRAIHSPHRCLKAKYFVHGRETSVTSSMIDAAVFGDDFL